MEKKWKMKKMKWKSFCMFTIFSFILSKFLQMYASTIIAIVLEDIFWEDRGTNEPDRRGVGQ